MHSNINIRFSVSTLRHTEEKGRNPTRATFAQTIYLVGPAHKFDCLDMHKLLSLLRFAFTLCCKPTCINTSFQMATHPWMMNWYLPGYFEACMRCCCVVLVTLINLTGQLGITFQHGFQQIQQFQSVSTPERRIECNVNRLYSRNSLTHSAHLVWSYKAYLCQTLHEDQCQTAERSKMFISRIAVTCFKLWIIRYRTPHTTTSRVDSIPWPIDKSKCLTLMCRTRENG